jgi:2-polyprenyl-3-methyl-5-hydroxy-6-metoxy-1,4-benzoquinol methylase
MDEQYGRSYRQLYLHHWWWRSREALVLRVIRRFAGKPPLKILDIGCGDGLLFPKLAPLGDVEGIEADPRLLTQESDWGSRITVTTVEDFDTSNRYGLILMLDVLEHLARPDLGLRAIHRLLEPGGILILTVPAHMSLWTRHDELNHHFTRYEQKELARLMAEAGLVVRSGHYFFHALYFAKKLIRLKERFLGASHGAPRVPPALINHLLTFLSGAEHRMFTAFRLPFGSSLLVVAQRPLN